MYEFTVNKKKYSIPFFTDVPMGAIRKSRKEANDMDKALLIIEETLGVDSEELAAIDSMTVDEFSNWLQGWTQGASLGEASGSAS